MLNWYAMYDFGCERVYRVAQSKFDQPFSHSLNEILEDFPRVLLVREPLPDYFTPESNALLTRSNMEILLVLHPLAIVELTDQPVCDYDVIVGVMCDDNDPEYISLREHAVVEMSFAEAESRIEKATLRPERWAKFAPALYAADYKNTISVIHSEIAKTMKDAGYKNFVAPDKSDASVLFNVVPLPEKTEMEPDRVYSVFHRLFYNRAAKKAFFYHDELSIIADAWSRSLSSVKDYFRDTPPANTAELIEGFGWGQVGKVLESGVPLTDALA